MAAFRQPGRKLNEECLSAAIGGRYAPAAKDREPQFAAINWIQLCRVFHQWGLGFSDMDRGNDLIFSDFSRITARPAQIRFIATLQLRHRTKIQALS
jgi:hypothetical protein